MFLFFNILGYILHLGIGIGCVSHESFPSCKKNSLPSLDTDVHNWAPTTVL